MALMLGYDVGSSSIKANLTDSETGEEVASATSPADKELEIIAKELGWAEQDPETWWTHVKASTAKLKAESKYDPADAKFGGISYQMHGLVVVDKDGKVLRPSIIWCDSRATKIGAEAETNIGQNVCQRRFFQSPANFTASKLRWVKENEPETYAKIHKAMLPGDYIAMRMTGNIQTTPSGLSEGILWDFQEGGLAGIVMDYYGISRDLIPDVVPTFSVQGELTNAAAKELGLRPGMKIAYRAGDQPNNALSLNVLEPGEVAVTAGTSGVVYGVSNQQKSDSASRVNVFVHVNHEQGKPRYGVLLCLNGTGILYSWLKHHLAGGMNYKMMNIAAAEVPPGCDGLKIFPYGNGAERTLDNRNIGAFVDGWNFNMHTRDHFLRAGQEGIVYALNYGLGIMRAMGVNVETVRAGDANMFLSPLFGEVFSTVTDATVELYNTNGAQGAARGAGIGAGIYKTPAEAFVGLNATRTITPTNELRALYADLYGQWKSILEERLAQRR